MPVRSLSSSVFKWPDADAVDRAVRRWAQEVAARVEGVARIGYFGSYARGDWGVGSDVDIIVLTEPPARPFAQRSAAFDATALPVPAEVLVYTVEEWAAMRGSRFHETVMNEAVWVWPDEG